MTRAYRRKIQILAAARDEQDLRRVKSLHLERLQGNRSGTSSIRITKQFRLVIRFETGEDGRIAVVIELVDYH
ncbi:plasmid maintenance system killer protein [Corynebacterium sp. zg912]|uniref:Plasmid maintenance system killer protein n=1 Tax=Corynebacterium wankanglinii TaxID=2735136 RepID=A0A7H0KC23_9CORY|nr:MULTISPECIES: type II toxin-antitoxin system RelE/ParE family toxin [Corynebacterium]MBA1836584.1 plasmid maintenance system killer protein [Corynebacterium wankanglinii]MCR5928583.1 plasmid maintenance system killer protein [Corynebacterium sp. zg912]QNP94839.1 type II toxin-antitoxin system RelE/ParE family toxin [Corynebacterium wankanglinii]